MHCSLSFAALFAILVLTEGSLYPRESITREVKSLNGIWTFRASSWFDQDAGFREKWFLKPLAVSHEAIPMPVPSSFNDITQNKTLRDYVGWAWYDTTFIAQNHWKTQKKRVILRFASVHYIAVVYVNGVQVTKHVGGHLPFQVDVTNDLHYGNINRLTVAVNNTLSPQTVPQGNVVTYGNSTKYPHGFHKVTLNFDFFNYAGIHRNVDLYIVPAKHIRDVRLNSAVNRDTATVNYTVVLNENSKDGHKCELQIWDAHSTVMIKNGHGCSSSVLIENPRLWWPFGMSEDPGYQYTIKVLAMDGNETIDEYVLKYGIRTINLTSKALLINDRPVYLQGFGKHEDSNIRGRGLDIPLIVKDFNVIKWLGANVFRTSHYPYSEELMDFADSQGIMVIDECPAVGLSRFDRTLLELHVQSLTELIQRDKNRPSVVMWSVANEPQSERPESTVYFEKVVAHVRNLDSSRPVTAALSMSYQKDNLAQFLDVLMINRYYAWYSDTGYTEVIQGQIIEEFNNWYQKHGKLLLISEYGADTITGLHQNPPFVFTEDYQVEFIEEYHKAFDVLREKGFFIGEMIWNFADFMTNQGTTRVLGNRKGILTRERQPKAAAYVIRKRYRTNNRSIVDIKSYCPKVECEQ